jgi:hypothetical protein
VYEYAAICLSIVRVSQSAYSYICTTDNLIDLWGVDTVLRLIVSFATRALVMSVEFGGAVAANFGAMPNYGSDAQDKMWSW